MDFWRDEYGQKVVIPLRVLGYPLKIWNTYQLDELCMLECADDDGPTFHAGHGTHSVQKFFEVLNDYRKKHRMSEQLIGGIDDTVGDPSEFEDDPGVSDPQYYGVSLQEQVEQVEDALSKAITVIEALVNQEIELRNDVYQAQLDAQDWQNKYNTVNDVREWDALLEDRDMFQNRCKELTNENDKRYIEALGRILELTDQNNQLELRNERQAERLGKARAAIDGLEY